MGTETETIESEPRVARVIIHQPGYSQNDPKQDPIVRKLCSGGTVRVHTCLTTYCRYRSVH